MFSSLAGTTVYSKLDLANAYLQLELEEESRKYVTIATHKGLYQYSRLPFRVASTPSIFQRTMENLLWGIPNMMVYIDDILVANASDKEHLETLGRVFAKLQESGLKLK